MLYIFSFHIHHSERREKSSRIYLYRKHLATPRIFKIILDAAWRIYATRNDAAKVNWLTMISNTNLLP